jgi:hypothetical protein
MPNIPSLNDGTQIVGEMQQALGMAGSVVRDLRNYSQQIEDRDDRLNALTEFTEFKNKQYEDYKTSLGSLEGDGRGFADQQNSIYENSLQSWKKTVLKTKGSQNYFEMYARQEQDAFFKRAMDAELNQGHTYRSATYDKLRNTISQSVYNDPVASEGQVNEFFSSLEAHRQFGMDQKEFLQESSKSRVEFSKNLAYGFGKDDPNGTLEKLRAGHFQKTYKHWEMDGETQRQVEGWLESQAKRQAVSEKFELRQSLRDYLKSVGETSLEAKVIAQNPVTSESRKKFVDGLGEDEVKTFEREAVIVNTAREGIISDWKNYGAWKPLPQPTDEIGSDVKRVREQTRQEITKLVQDHPVAAADRYMKMFSPPEAAADLANDPTGASLYAQRVAVQLDVFKIPMDRVQIMPPEEAKSHVARMMTMGPEQVRQNFDLIDKTFNQTIQYTGEPNTNVSDIMRRQLFAAGLPKVYAFISMGDNTVYGGRFIEAMKHKEGRIADSLTSQQVRETQDALRDNTQLNAFLGMIARQPNGAEYAAELRSNITKTIYLSLDQPGSGRAANVAASVVNDMITKQYATRGTYYIPLTDPMSKQPIDPDRTERHLEIAGKKWQLPNGKKFVPVNSEAYDSTNLVWLPLENGTGVYRAAAIPGHPGGYSTIYDREGRRFELTFRDAPVASRYGAGSSISQKSGVILPVPKK